MTARERAINELIGTWIGGADDYYSQVRAKDAETLLGQIESAGLVIIDRELHKALVEAVQTVNTCRTVDEDDVIVEQGYIESAHHAVSCAVALLAEKGE